MESLNLKVPLQLYVAYDGSVPVGHYSLYIPPSTNSVRDTVRLISLRDGQMTPYVIRHPSRRLLRMLRTQFNHGDHLEGADYAYLHVVKLLQNCKFC